MSDLAYFCVDERGRADEILCALAGRLRAAGLRLAGVVQTNDEWHPERACDMNLHLLSDPARGAMLISERLGAGATGCRLNAAALEEAAGLVEASLPGADLLIVNKFGKREAEGGGFRDAIARAIEAGIPVLTAAGPKDSLGLTAFAGELAERIAPEAAFDWALARAGAGAD